MTNNHREKQITSTILIPYGIVENIPRPFTTDEGTVIAFKLSNRNKLQVNLNFTDTSLNQEDALTYAKEKTSNIAHSISLQHKLNTQVVSTHLVVWGNGVSSERRATMSASAAIALPIDIASEFSAGLSKHSMSLDFFDKALQYKEMSGKDREVGFWLYFSLEALQVELYNRKNINRLASEVSQAGVTTRTSFNAYKNSVGSYYRHFESSYDGETLSIEACVEIHRNMLLRFVELAE
ncbi:MAG: hypothetical protein BroJett025_10520 [Patescibacteria group bacterium]|nr:MAG: hypothetical protein BroJett025_10520 [Patescibacteria group bacterium]